MQDWIWKRDPRSQEVDENNDVVWDEDEEERVKMEIMLGMAQEEGPPCLLCLLPRCICHITLGLVFRLKSYLYPSYMFVGTMCPP